MDKQYIEFTAVIGPIGEPHKLHTFDADGKVHRTVHGDLAERLANAVWEVDHDADISAHITTQAEMQARSDAVDERDRLRAVVETLLRRIDAARPGTDVFPLRGSQEAHDVRAALDVCGKAQPNPHCCGHPTWVHEGTGDRACLWQSDLPGGGYAKASLRRGSSCPCEALDVSADMGGEPLLCENCGQPLAEHLRSDGLLSCRPIAGADE